MIFTSPYSKLSIVIKPSRHTSDSSGERVFQAGKRADFFNGQFKTEDKEIIDALLNHKDLNVMFHAQGVKTDNQKAQEAKEEEQKLAEKTTAKSTNKKGATKKS